TDEPGLFDAPVVVSVRARDADGRQGAARLELEPDPLGEPVNAFQRWPLPPELLGGLNVAWTGLGAETVFASEDEEGAPDRMGAGWIFDGMTPMYYDFLKFGLWGWVARETGLEEYMPAVKLAGAEPVEVAGFLLNPTTSEDRPAALREFAVWLSLDGEEYS